MTQQSNFAAEKCLDLKYVLHIAVTVQSEIYMTGMSRMTLKMYDPTYVTTFYTATSTCQNPIQLYVISSFHSLSSCSVYKVAHIIMLIDCHIQNSFFSCPKNTLKW